MSAGLPAQEKSWLLEWAFLVWGTEKARDAGYPLGGDGLAWGCWEVALVSCTTRENGGGRVYHLFLCFNILILFVVIMF